MASCKREDRQQDEKVKEKEIKCLLSLSRRFMKNSSKSKTNSKQRENRITNALCGQRHSGTSEEETYQISLNDPTRGYFTVEKNTQNSIEMNLEKMENL